MGGPPQNLEFFKLTYIMIPFKDHIVENLMGNSKTALNLNFGNTFQVKILAKFFIKKLI